MGQDRDIGLVMQGGGALGAYEFGAVEALLARGFRPRVVSGVSIGAVNAAVLAGARGGGEGGPSADDMARSLRDLWARITLPDNPFLPRDSQQLMSAFGDPAFWRPRLDWFAAPTWTSLSDTSPMYATLDSVVDFDRINAERPPVRLAVTATCVEDGANTVFSNVDPVGDRHLASHAVASHAEREAASPPLAIKGRTRPFAARHVMASGALPPGFPMVEIDGRHYWDGGLFDNTPLSPLVEMLTEDEAETLPIVVIELFPNKGELPGDLQGVQTRMMEIQYESRFADGFGGPKGTRAFAGMLRDLHEMAERDPGVFASVGGRAHLGRLLLYRALRNLHVIEAEPGFKPTGAMDFSAFGVGHRREAGRRAVESYLAANGGGFPAPG